MAAIALAGFDQAKDPSAKDRWRQVSYAISDELLKAVSRNPSHFVVLRDLLRPLHATLAGPLTEAYRHPDEQDAARAFATSILADYAKDDPELLITLLLDADAKQFAQIYDPLIAHGKVASDKLADYLNLAAKSLANDNIPDIQFKRTANAALGLAKIKG